MNSLHSWWSTIPPFEQLFWYFAIPASLALLILLAATACGEESPQTVTMALGSTRSVADGRARIWYGEASDKWVGGLEAGRLETVADLEVRCGDESHNVMATSELSADVCGIQVRLDEVRQGGSMAAELVVVWDDP